MSWVITVPPPAMSQLPHHGARAALTGTPEAREAMEAPEEQAPQLARVTHPQRPAHGGQVAELVHDGQATGVLPSDRDDAVRRRQRGGQRLLADDVLASAQGADDDFLVERRRSAHGDQIDVGSVDQGREVAADDGHAMCAGRRAELRVVHVADGEEPRPPVERGERERMLVEDRAGAHDSDSDEAAHRRTPIRSCATSASCLAVGGVGADVRKGASVALEDRVRRSVCHDAPAVEDDDLVGRRGERQRVADDQRRAAGEQRAKARDHGRLALRVQAGGRLVENQDPRVAHERAREPDALALAAREADALGARDACRSPRATSG